EYVVTEAGFGADLGAEKFLDIKCGYGNISPKAVVLVATVRALKYHGGQPREELKTPNPEALRMGLGNLEKHIENIKQFGLPPVVAINKFVTDSEEELNIIRDECSKAGVHCALCEGWEFGGEGTKELAKEVVKAAESCKDKYSPIYDWSESIEAKVEKVAKKIYGAGSVVFQPKAKAGLETIKRLGLDKLPICVAKTQNSLSDNTKLLGRPEGFKLTVREFEIAAGAGFVIPITGTMLRMPGLPAVPAAEGIDIDKDGNITGLS
ncbi:MAG: formate--tetrahydrofolate ligase, partial [Cyclobacteriaceae bacterium]|nr:formate--tetrahydrofolate ligase [Cyclobacteriaceae bacterium]